MTREDLEQIRKLAEQIASGLEHLAELHARAESRAIRYNTIGGSHGSPVNKLELVECAIDEQERRIDRMIDRRYALKLRALTEIKAAGLEVEERHIIYLRYLSRDRKTGLPLSWPQVIRPVNLYHNIQERKIRYLHDHAVSILASYHI